MACIFSNELSPIVLYVYQFCEKLDTLGGSYRTRVISVIYKKGDKKKLQTTDPSHF